MSVSVASPLSVRGLCMAGLVTRSMTVRQIGDGLCAQGSNAPLAVLMQTSSGVAIFDLFGAPIELERFEQDYPGQLDEFLRLTRHAPVPNDRAEQRR